MKIYHVEVHYTAIVQSEYDSEAIRNAMYIAPYDPEQVRGLKMRVAGAHQAPKPEPTPEVDQPDGSAI